MSRAGIWIVFTAAVAVAGMVGVPAAHAGATSYPDLRLGGFTDVNFLASDVEERPTSSFAEGQFVLHFTSALAPRFTFFGEVTLSPRDDEFGIEVERSFIKYSANDYLKLSAGRFHTPINWWNVAFHHGLWLQTSTGRPEMTKFGSRFIPVHFVGVLAEGTLPASEVSILYTGGLGNGRSGITSRAGDRRDANDNRAWFGKIGFKPDRLYWLEIGGGVYRDKVTLGDSMHLREWIGSAYLVWNKETPELIAEYAHVRHEDALDRVYSGDALYVQAAYRLPGLDHQVKPYARWETMNVRPEDPVFQGQVDDFERYVAGVRWDASTLVAVKAEYRFTRFGEGAGQTDENSTVGQISVAF